ncbi:MAG: U32 family peptidase [Sodaliphilus sp.]
MQARKRYIELLAPARDAETAIQAILHGADAVYIGPQSHGARAAVGNTTADIGRVVAFAHQFGAKVYATVNTLVYDHEIPAVEKLITDLYKVGVDALIVQDMGILRMNIPPIALHASTQCDLRTPEKAEFLQDLGFSQLVMARELSLNEISVIHNAVPHTPLEAFVHGALCVSYSGRCQVSQCLKGRSANRGECAQICRLPFDLMDNRGNVLMRNKHLLSLKDFNASTHIEQMLEAGVSSFKIEGRLKDVPYVKNVVAYYRNAIDRIIAKHPDKYVRASQGISQYTFEPNLSKSFNRSFTDYFLAERKPISGTAMASIHTPKSIGEPIGHVIVSKGKTLKISTTASISNGDGISYFNDKGEYVGFRVNRVDGANLFLKSPLSIKAGTMLYRTYDKAFNDALAAKSADRKISITAHLWWAHGALRLELNDERGNRIVSSLECNEPEPANKSQEQQQIQTLSKLGGTIYQLVEAIVPGNHFIPSSLLAQLKRNAIGALDRAQRITYQRLLRRPENEQAECFATSLTYADNVANHLAEQLYHEHGVHTIQPAIEIDMPKENVPVMHTRYCLRRELGACKKEKGARLLPDPLILRTAGQQLEVHCDCQKCEMQIRIK